MTEQLFWVASFQGSVEQPTDVVLFENLTMEQVRRNINLAKDSTRFFVVWLEMPTSNNYKRIRLNAWRKLATGTKNYRELAQSWTT